VGEVTDLAIAPAIQRSADHFYTYIDDHGVRHGPFPGVTGMLEVLGANFSAASRYGAKQAATTVADILETGSVDAMWAAQKREGFIAGITASAVNHRNERAALGTDVHAMAELVVKGEPTPPMAEATRKRVLHYAEWWKNAGWTLRLAEAMVVFPTHRYGGTFDLLAYDRDGRTVLADVKTGKGVYKEVALQLAAYSLAPIVAPTGSPKAYPMPKVDRHVVLHVTTEGVREVEIAVGTAEHMAWLACVDLHTWAESMKGKKF
jgi:hypothetical protein